MMTGQELSTAVQENIPVKIVVCDNNVHGSIIKGQLDKYGDANAFIRSWEALISSNLQKGMVRLHGKSRIPKLGLML